MDRKQWINSCQPLKNKLSSTAINPDRLSGPLSWMLRSLSSHSFKTLDQKDFAEYIWRSGEKEKRKETWETAMQWEEHLVCHSNGPEEDLWATVSVTSWMTLSWVLGLVLTSCYFPAYFVPFQIISFLCLLQQMLSHPGKFWLLFILVQSGKFLLYPVLSGWAGISQITYYLYLKT